MSFLKKIEVLASRWPHKKFDLSKDRGTAWGQFTGSHGELISAIPHGYNDNVYEFTFEAVSGTCKGLVSTLTLTLKKDSGDLDDVTDTATGTFEITYNHIPISDPD